MKLKCGGVEGGWIQVVDIDMNRDDSCPGTWHKITTPRRLCLGYVAGCASTHFFTKGLSFAHICGQIKREQRIALSLEVLQWTVVMLKVFQSL